MSDPVTLYHGLSRWGWELVKHSGQLRPAYGAQAEGRLYKVVAADRGSIYFCDDPATASVYAAWNPELRFTWWIKGVPTRLGKRRWTVPGRVAYDDGVVIAADFEDGELTFIHRTNSHPEYATDQCIDADRLRVVAFIPKGSKVDDALRRCEQVPPLPQDDREKLEEIDPDADIFWPGPLVADLEGARYPLAFLNRLTGGDAGAAPDPEQVAHARQGIPPIGSPPQLLPLAPR
jgi:hypothetical protein